MSSIPDPDTPNLREAMCGDQLDSFLAAMGHEILELEFHGTWTVVCKIHSGWSQFAPFYVGPHKIKEYLIILNIGASLSSLSDSDFCSRTPQEPAAPSKLETFCNQSRGWWDISWDISRSVRYLMSFSWDISGSVRYLTTSINGVLVARPLRT
jgi:hypothetical protein